MGVLTRYWTHDDDDDDDDDDDGIAHTQEIYPLAMLIPHKYHCIREIRPIISPVSLSFSDWYRT